MRVATTCRRGDAAGDLLIPNWYGQGIVQALRNQGPMRTRRWGI